MTSEIKPKAARTASDTDDKSFVDVLKSLVGKSVTMVNPESYEDAPVGHQIRAGFYEAKVAGVGRDFLTIVTEFKRKGREATAEPVKSFIPLDKIKRVSLMKSARLIHL